MNTEVFFDFVRGDLIPHMRPFDGISSASIAIMDNLSVHHAPEIIDLFQKAGILLLFLPPFSPDLNPIQEAFSYVKYYLKRHDELLQSLPDPTIVVKHAFMSITSDLCKSWIKHSVYPLP